MDFISIKEKISMMTVCEKGQCAGCGACVDKCALNAIKIKDSNNCYDAVIDSVKCIGCNACHSICPNNNMPKLVKTLLWKQGWADDNSIRMNSSSGGVASAIELEFIKRGGVVSSCCFSSGKFKFDIASTIQDVKSFTGSKYVKSNPEGIYKMIQMELKNNKKLLFVGLPCQVAAVKNFVGESENLYTIDLICHGTPSPEILRIFLRENNINLDELNDIRFREKNKFRLKADNKYFSNSITTDNYITTFLDGISYTENCYKCKFAQRDRVGDITLGDSWGSELEQEVKEQGVSLILCQTPKGKELLQHTKLILKDVDLNNAIENNHQLVHPTYKPKQRKKFFVELKKKDSFKRAFVKCYLHIYIKNVIKTIAFKLKLYR